MVLGWTDGVIILLGHILLDIACNSDPKMPLRLNHWTNLHAVVP